MREETTLRVNWTAVIPSAVGLSSQQFTAVKELLTTLPVQASARGKDLGVLEHLCAQLTWSQLGCQGEGLTSLTQGYTVHFWASGYQHQSLASKQAAFRPVGSKFSLQHPSCLGASCPSCLKEVFSSVCLSVTGSLCVVLQPCLTSVPDRGGEYALNLLREDSWKTFAGSVRSNWDICPYVMLCLSVWGQSGAGFQNW